MKEDKKFWISIFIKDVLILFVLIISANIFNFILKNQVSETFTNEVRNDFLLSSHREINRKILSFIDHNDFYEIKSAREIFHKNTNQNSINDFFSVKIKHPIYSNSIEQKGFIELLVFKYSVIPITFYTLLAWFILNLFLILFIPRLKKHLELTILKEQELLNIKREAELAFQISHDIRSPLAALNSIAENLKNNNEDYRLLQNSITRINEIANNLLNNNKEDYVELPSFHPIAPLIQEIIEEKKNEYSKKGIEINFQNSNHKSALIVPSEFKRIISNLINNSIEATDQNPKIQIELLQKEDNLKIIIKDNGKGIPEKILQTLGTKAITTKTSGNGLGLKHAYSTIKEWEGSFNVIETNENGTTIEIILKADLVTIAKSESSLTILIDDDALTRATWESKAKKAEIAFQSFKDIPSFKESLSTLDKNAVIYIDSELGEIKGETLAKELHEMGFLNLSIASGHPAERFKEYAFLKSVISKKAPF